MLLKIEGAICKSGVPSTHLMAEDGIGRQVNVGTITLTRQDLDLAGVPIFSPKPGVQIGTITRSWWDAEDVLRIEGEIRDTPEARYWMSKKTYTTGGSSPLSAAIAKYLAAFPQEAARRAQFLKPSQCGLCPELNFADDTKVGSEVNLKVQRVNITLPGHSGFAESWVRFADPSVKYMPPTVEPGKMGCGDFFVGRGF